MKVRDTYSLSEESKPGSNTEMVQTTNGGTAYNILKNFSFLLPDR